MSCRYCRVKQNNCGVRGLITDEKGSCGATRAYVFVHDQNYVLQSIILDSNLSSRWKEQISIFRVHRQDLPHRQTALTSARQLPERFGDMFQQEHGGGVGGEALEHGMANLEPMFTGLVVVGITKLQRSRVTKYPPPTFDVINI